MRVVIIRHAEVDFCWSKRCTSAKFDSDCREYDLSPIKNVTYPQYENEINNDILPKQYIDIVICVVVL